MVYLSNTIRQKQYPVLYTTMATIIEPPLTSVAQPAHEIGIEAAKILIEQIESQKSFKPKTIILNGQLNIRASSIRT
ncbi:substrate-binding domain-containing protein [Flavobacterium sp.]|uniref:substrate-binding domain-containing protein n=1 Tax=Flavobacterium sp. TaxID=239 RepID=UPI003C44AEE9